MHLVGGFVLANAVVIDEALQPEVRRGAFLHDSVPYSDLLQDAYGVRPYGKQVRVSRGVHICMRHSQARTHLRRSRHRFRQMLPMVTS